MEPILSTDREEAAIVDKQNETWMGDEDGGLT